MRLSIIRVHTYTHIANESKFKMRVHPELQEIGVTTSFKVSQRRQRSMLISFAIYLHLRERPTKYIVRYSNAI